jgi:sugar O-acyltransferase (sialic acid O-acetyltransferase NeuD family)
MIEVVILGAAGNCVDIADAIDACNAAGQPPVKVKGFLDDAKHLQGTVIAGLPVLGPLAMARDLDGVRLVCGVGGPSSHRAKKDVVRATGRTSSEFHTVVHPSAALAGTAAIGEGSVILAHTSVCSRARIGKHVMILPNVVVGHDSEIGDTTVVAAGVVVSGMVHVGEGAYLGAAASIRQGVRVGDGALVGMGSVVLRDVDPGDVVVGVPARSMGR